MAAASSVSGVVHWIDHYVLCTEDVPRWARFHEQVLGAVTLPAATKTQPGVFQDIGSIRHGGFKANQALPPTKGLGAGLPRFGYYIEQNDVDAHLRRLRAAGAVYAEPVDDAGAGERGVSIKWQDPDGNQFEFWAPDTLPPGAMAGCGPERIGRISHGIYESRDLARTADFFKRYAELDPIRDAPVDDGVLAFRLASGGRIVYRRVDELGGRTTGMGLRTMHTGLLVHEDAFLPNYDRLWAGIPEWDYDPDIGITTTEGPTLPARSVRHPSPAGRKFHALRHRGDDFFDWDTNLFHFFGGTPRNGSLAVYEGRDIDTYLEEALRRVAAG